MPRTSKLSTRKAIAAMLTENTGRHFLDSGDAYGRHWQRNAGATWRHFDAAPDATIDHWGTVSISVYHWVVENLTYDAKHTARFRAFANAAKRADDSWMENMVEFAEHMSGLSHHGKCEVSSINTYNHEDLLSQVLQWVEYDDPEWGDRMVLLQVHGGADVRGGYTAPRVFRVDDIDYLYSFADASIYCEGTDLDGPPIGQVSLDGRTVTDTRKVQHSWRLFGGRVEDGNTRTRDEFGEWDDDYDIPTDDLNRLDTDDDGHPLCPVEGCTGRVRASMH